MLKNKKMKEKNICTQKIKISDCPGNNHFPVGLLRFYKNAIYKMSEILKKYFVDNMGLIWCCRNKICNKKQKTPVFSIFCAPNEIMQKKLLIIKNKSF